MMEWRTYWWGVQITATNEAEEALLHQLHESLEDDAKEEYEYGGGDGTQKENHIQLSREQGDGWCREKIIDGLTLEIQR